MLDFSRPGKLADHGFIEVINGRFHAECPRQHGFLPLPDAAEKLEAWRRYDNEEGPHGAIGNKVPITLMKSGRHQPVTLNEAGKLCLCRSKVGNRIPQPAQIQALGQKFGALRPFTGSLRKIFAILQRQEPAVSVRLSSGGVFVWKGQAMGLISMIPAPVLPLTRPGVSVAAAGHGVVHAAAEPPPIWPVSASASSAALVRDHWTGPAFTRPHEAEGLELDGIPFIDDEAILLDDLPKDAPAPEAKQDSDAAAPPVPTANSYATDPDQTPDQRRSEAAARAYEDARAISGLHPHQAALTKADTSDAHISVTGPENRPRR